MKPALLLIAAIGTFTALFARQAPATDTLHHAVDTTYTLTGVTVAASHAFIEVKGDKLVVNVAQSPMAAGDNMYEVMKRIPGVTDMQGLQYRGKQAQVYINGSPSRLTAEDLKTFLAGMPAGSVEKVEVLGNPSARYEAGSNAIINIILAKNKSLGTNGTVTAGGGADTYGRYNTGASLNYRNAKANLYGSYDFQHVTVNGGSETQRVLSAGSLVADNQYTTDRNRSHNYKAGLDYTLTAKQSIGFLFRGAVNTGHQSSDNQTNTHYADKYISDSSTNGNSQRNTTLSTAAANVYYKLKTGGNSMLTVNGDYYRFTKDKQINFDTHYIAGEGNEYQAPYLFRNSSHPNNHISSVSADYNFMFDSIQVEAGTKGIFTQTDNNYVWDNYTGNNWVYDSTISNRFIYHENVYAAYATAARTFGHFDVSAGLRIEHTATSGNSVTLQQVNKRSYTNLFPSAGITWNASAQQQFTASYSRKIERFGFDIVNPFMVYQSTYSRYQGNPGIQPTYTDNIDFSWSYGSHWMSSFSYSNYRHVLAEVYRQAPGEDYIVSSFDNVNGATQLTLTVTGIHKFFHGKLTSTNNLMLLHAQYHAEAGSNLNRSSLAAMYSSNNIVTLSSTWKAEVNASYMSALTFGAYSFRPQFGLGWGITHQLWQKRAGITLNMTDVFNSNKQRYTTSSYGTYAFSKTLNETRFVKLTFSWRFGNQQVKAAAGRRTGIDEVKGRME